MFQSIFNIITKEFSGKNAKEIIGGIANFHRIQSSPGFRAAAKYCQEKLEDYSISNIETHSYPAQGFNQYWGNPIPKEWSISSASLDLIEPTGEAKNLCRFFENPCSIIQRSKATPEEGITAEVVVLPRGLSEEEMKKYNIKGKFILTDEPDLTMLRLAAINKLGAVGIIYDLVSELKPIRTRANFPTARRYTSFWYGTKKNEGDALGFVLSAEQGEELRKLISRVEKENKKNGKQDKVKLHAKIDSKFYEGKMEVVDCLIPGKKEGQEILALAHLCHPKPGAIDNASGCGTLIEVARTLKTLISSGKLEPPKRSIRFLLMAEFTGTYCYLATNEEKIDNFVAGINLDMVGADQCVDGGRTLIMERSHNSNPSYVNDVLSAIVDNASRQVPNFVDSGAIATFKYANDQPFSGGSDHALLGHPDVGIGTPMFIQWPDRYYHTGEDTLEKVSPEMLQIIGAMTAAYCYFIANASLPEMLWITREVASKGKERITKHSREMSNKLVNNLQGEKEKIEQENMLADFLGKIDGHIIFRRDVELEALNSVLKLTQNNDENKTLKQQIKELEKAIMLHAENEINQTKTCMENIAKALTIEPKRKPEKREIKEQDDEKMVPKRIFKGPLSGLNLNDLTIEERIENKKIDDEFKGMHSVLSSAFYWIDGKRTIGEIAKLIEYDIGKTSISYLVKILRFLEKHQLVKL